VEALPSEVTVKVRVSRAEEMGLQARTLKDLVDEFSVHQHAVLITAILRKACESNHDMKDSKYNTSI